MSATVGWVLLGVVLLLAGAVCGARGGNPKVRHSSRREWWLRAASGALPMGAVFAFMKALGLI